MAKNSFSKLDTDKKDTGVNEGAASVDIEKGKQTGKKQPAVSKQEAEARRESMKTQGVKGVRAKRIEMAFSDSNYRFIKIMSTSTGMTMTQVVNNILEQYREEHGSLYQKALDVYQEFTGEKD